MRRIFLLCTAALAAALPVHAQDYPKLKPGQWEIVIDRGKAAEGAPPIKTTMCTDEATQQQMMTTGAGMARDACTKNEFRRDGARFVGTAECKFGESKMVSRSVMTLTGDTAYRMDIKATFEPAFMGMKDSQTTLDGKYVGACRDGLVPGDMIGPGGQKFNIKNMGQGKAPPVPKSAPNATQNAPAKKAAQ